MDMSMGDAGSRGTRWVCPNDRHLALRAKLRTGWSVKTGSLDSRWGDYPNPYTSGTNRCGQSFVLSEEERQTIIQVIQRAEALDLSEQERVGRLVERLENMKRNVCIVTSTRLSERKSCGSRCSLGTRCVCACALCGEKFGAVLGATPSLCKDCRKYICQKCGIETTGPNSTFPNVSPSPRGVSGMMKLTQERAAMQRIVKRSSSNAQRQFLCRICAETREMWKKSGAWFFKGMPKYILPEKKERGWSRTAHKTSTWTLGGRSLESNEPQDSSSDEDTTRRLAVARGHSTSSTNLPANQDNTVRTFSPLSTTSQGVSNISNNKTSPGRRSNGLSPLGNREEISDRLDRSNLSIASQCSHISPTGSIATFRMRTNGKTSNGHQVEQRVSFEDEVMADEKTNKSEEVDDADDDVRRTESNSIDRLKTSQVQSLRSNSLTTPTTPTTPTMSTERIQEQLITHEKSINRESNRTFSDQENYSSGTINNGQADLPRFQVSEYSHGSLLSVTNCQTKSNKFDSTLATNGTKLWDSRSLLAIRPSSSVPPVQSGTSTRIKIDGHTWSRRSVLQAQHTANRDSDDKQTTSNKDRAQDAGSRVQRDAELLRDNGNRYVEWQSITRIDPPGRPVGPRLPRRSEVSPPRITAVPDKTFQCVTTRTLPSGQRRGSLGCVFDRTGTNPSESKLLYTTTSFDGHGSSGYKSPSHGQQRIF